MSPNTLKIQRIDSRRDDIRAAMGELRGRLSPRGDVVSREGRRRTMEIFGEPLSPVEVVRRICRDVDEKGLAAVLDYSARVDKADLAPETLRVSEDKLAQANAQERNIMFACISGCQYLSFNASAPEAGCYENPFKMPQLLSGIVFIDLFRVDIFKIYFAFIGCSRMGK